MDPRLLVGGGMLNKWFEDVLPKEEKKKK